MTTNNKIRIAAVGDIHVRKTDHGKWADYFAEISQNADVLVICGDLTDTGDEEEARILTDELRSCNIPVVAVLGNHDYEKGRQKIIRQILEERKVHVLDGEAVVIKGVGIAGVKGFCGGFDRYMVPMFGEDAMKAFVNVVVNETLLLDRALSRLEQEHPDITKVAIMHYAPIEATIKGEPDVIHAFLGSSRLAEPLTRRNVTVAFHGHAHVGTLEGEASGGVKVFNVARPVLMKAGIDKGYLMHEVAVMQNTEMQLNAD
jgi:Icc-related predicted phosphoesterase